MTTIAWDGKTLAVDSRETAGDILIENNMKKLYTNVGKYRAVAITGGTMEMRAIIDWISEGESGDMPRTNDSGAVVCITHDGKAFTYHPNKIGNPEAEKAPLTNGSGWQIALGALEAGATAIDAVEIACKYDLFSGGKIQSFTLGNECGEGLN